MRLAREIVRAFNDFTATDAAICRRLYVHRVAWAAKLSPSDNLLRFRRTNDKDGFLAELATEQMTVLSDVYQVKLTVQPGGGIFEASVKHDRKADTIAVDLAHVSRVNKYGVQASCIMDSNPELRKYCYCKVNDIDKEAE